MYFVVFDDEPRCGEGLKRHLERESPGAVVTVFHTIRALLFSLPDLAERTDALFMDIRSAEETDGIAAAVRIARDYPGLRLIYVTGYNNDYSQRIFDVPPEALPFAYLTKPIAPHYLRAALRRLAEEKNTQKLVVKHGRSAEFLSVDEIVAVKSEKRKLYIFTLASTVETYERLGAFAERFSGRLIRVHKSWLVNLRHIRSLTDQQTVETANGRSVPIGRSYLDPLKNAILADHVRRLEQGEAAETEAIL
ncbi:MAG: LytTR family transcriptional regulator DNA-binding domain-containing protein [Bacteroides sp.]|nr:LytTR family transcriptional regulator DNA-binding domain-containing protein [Eubacterium sp.]MCM1417698.1 LytTR family transcriptional regulator DNA-binding domain-containing protein [Roseburia sp.]MCM1461836.1 LytTR family transcriptional regulator DNA-binding domain-containing protein [Bacteroides sp.]